MISIDFSLFSSPTKAYGNISGQVDHAGAVSEGDEIVLLAPRAGEWFSGRLRVRAVAELPNDGLLVRLEPLVAQSPDEAAYLGARFEAEAGLFCDVYE
jgi:hypothetical protein